MFSLESPQRGDSDEYTQYVIINIKKKITLNYPKCNNVCTYGIFSQGLKNEFDKAVVNEPSVFEPLKFYCICFQVVPVALMAAVGGVSIEEAALELAKQPVIRTAVVNTLQKKKL